MACAAYGKPFGDTFHNPQKYRFQKFYEKHEVSSFTHLYYHASNPNSIDNTNKYMQTPLDTKLFPCLASVLVTTYMIYTKKMDKYEKFFVIFLTKTIDI